MPRQRSPMSRRRRALLLLPVAAVVLCAAAVGLLTAPGDGTGGPPSRPPGLNDLWGGRAALVLDRKWTSQSLGQDGGAYAGSHVEVVDGAWYLFNRQTYPEQCGSRGPRMGTQVRRSTDRGRTWSAPTPILAPTEGTPWACAATDGDAVYEESRGVWRYLFQCHDASSPWAGCYAERRDQSPMGPFEAVGRNPVIAPGGLWSRICAAPTDQCHRPAGQRQVADEGTFNIFSGGGTGWWVGFHGTDGTRAFRGIARTSTFRPGDWHVDGDAGTPTDAVIGREDATSWRESWQGDGPVGAGAASVLLDGGFYYQLAEVPDLSLGCTPGQNWDLGLFRAREAGDTRWEQYPAGNPVVYSSRTPEDGGKAIRCNVEYPGLFKDPDADTVYAMHGRISRDPANDGIYVYRLEWDRNLLYNGDLARADAQGWDRPEGAATQIDVPRAPDGSPDGTPYLSFNCGPGCGPGQGVYQDVPVRGHAGETVAFGGDFRSDGGPGALQVTLFQFDAQDRVIADSHLPVTTGDSYAPARKTVKIDERARRLRFQLTPGPPSGLRADNLYVIPQSGCEAARYPAC